MDDRLRRPWEGGAGMGGFNATRAAMGTIWSPRSGRGPVPLLSKRDGGTAGTGSQGGRGIQMVPITAK
jgi:hypothetical protein